jgi:aspartyl-tRNA(Asn)/glutamyl-tRNA(Gln) amidotransferase subunit C
MAMVDGCGGAISPQPCAMSVMVAFGMPAAFTRDDVAKIAALAHLELEPAELDLFARQLGDILAYAEQVQQIDTTGVPPTAGVLTGPAADRADVVCDPLDRDEVLANAPDAALDAGLFRVPRVIG